VIVVLRYAPQAVHRQHGGEVRLGGSEDVGIAGAAGIALW